MQCVPGLNPLCMVNVEAFWERGSEELWDSTIHEGYSIWAFTAHWLSIEGEVVPPAPILQILHLVLQSLSAVD